MNDFIGKVPNSDRESRGDGIRIIASGRKLIQDRLQEKEDKSDKRGLDFLAPNKLHKATTVSGAMFY